MSDVLFEELGIPKPDCHLEACGGSRVTQTAKIVVALEDIFLKARPDCALIVSDVNSTLACSIVAKNQLIPVAHVKAGFRRGDKRMPEKINHLVTDSISDRFSCTEPSRVEKLLYQRDKLALSDSSGMDTEAVKAKYSKYGVVTLRRPSVFSDQTTFHGIAGALSQITEELPLVFAVHPQTRGNLEKFGLDLGVNVQLTKLQSYMEFLNLWKDVSLILTDSGGLLEETTALGIPCLTLR